MSPLLSVEDLTVHFAVRRGFGKKSTDVVHAADEVSLAIEPGQTLALVGESGSGKTTVARAILQLTKPTGGRIVFQGRDIGSLKRSEKRSAMSDAQVVFQDPYSSLSPRLTVHDVIAEPLSAQSRLSGSELSDADREPARDGRSRHPASVAPTARVLGRAVPADRHRPGAGPGAQARRAR